MGLLETLRAGTATLHERIEAGPYARSVLDGSLSMAQYGQFLRGFYVVHAALEGTLDTCQHPGVRAVWRPEMKKLPALASDLEHLGASLHAVDVPTLRAELLAQRIRLLALKEPAALLGVLYVLEGATLGGLAQRSTLAQRPELSAGGLAYLSGYGRDTRPSFERFVERLESVALSADERAQALAGAIAVYEGLEAVFLALGSGSEAVPGLTAQLNPEAGSHAIPADLREIAAALRAGELSWARFPYYEARYGERGRRFTRSDSAWLVTLVEAAPAQVSKHVTWLGRVLASRGMPRFLLEEHLRMLADELASTIPERAAHYVVLRELADTLRTERERVISKDSFEQLADQFERRVGPELARPLPHTGRLIVSAVCDELCGLQGAVASLSSWLCDPARFPEPWITAVNGTITSARKARVLS